MKRSKKLIVLIQNEKIQLHDIKEEYFEEEPNQVISASGTIQFDTDDKKVVSLLIELPNNQNINNTLKKYSNVKYIVVSVSDSDIFINNNPKIKNKIYALFKEGHISYFSSSFLKK